VRVLRGNSGLGDAIYLRPVAEILKKTISGLTVTTPYVDVFRNSGISVIPFRKDKTDLCVSAGSRKKEPTTQFQDICILAGIPKETELKINWGVFNPALVEQVKSGAQGKPIMLVKSSYMPFGRRDDFGKDLMPDYQKMDNFLGEIGKSYFKVLIGAKDRQYYFFKNIDMDLWSKTTIADLFDVANIADCAVTQVGYTVPMMESFNKKVMIVFSDKGLKSKEEYLRLILPHKLINKKTTSFFTDVDPMSSMLDKFRQMESVNV